MKKFLHVVLPCLLTLAFYLSHNSSFSLAPSTNDRLSGRRLVEELSIPETEPAGEHKVESLEIKGGLQGEEHEDGDDEGLIFNADYHGVMTHPSPLPKHPKP